MHTCIYTHTHTESDVYTGKLIQVTLHRIIGLFRSKKDEYQKVYMVQLKIFKQGGTEEAFEGNKCLLHFVTSTLCFQLSA